MIYALDLLDSVKVAPGGAVSGSTSVPLLTPLVVRLPVGTVLDYGGAKFARVATSGPRPDGALVGDSTVTVDPLPTTLVGGETADYGPPTGHSYLPNGWADKSQAWRDDQQALAEDLLELSDPAYTGADGEAITRAIALQIAFQLAQGMTQGMGAQVTKTASETNVGGGSGLTTTFHDRVVHPGAALIVQRVTGRRVATYVPTQRGV